MAIVFAGSREYAVLHQKGGIECMKAKTVTASLIVLAAVAPLLQAQDMVKVAPKNYRVVLDNDRVRVIRVVIEPRSRREP